jgi:hypothetical protein
LSAADPKIGIQPAMHAARLLLISLVAALPAVAQAPLTQWSSDAFNLRFSYPSDLIQADTGQAMQDDHITLLGISGTGDSALAAATHCLRPALFVTLPPGTGDHPATANILLAELDVTCLTPEQQNHPKDLLDHMAESVNRVPGMMPISAPSTYNIGWQKVHMAAAQGEPGGAERVFTMAISTVANNHLLVWFFSSNNIAQLNRITKSTVRFGRSDAAPIYPLQINDGRLK